MVMRTYRHNLTILTDSNSVPDPVKDKITGACTIGKIMGTHHLT